MPGAHSTNEEPTGPRPGAIAFSVFLSTVAGIIVFVVGIGIANDSYRSVHQLAPVERGFWFFTHYEAAPVSFEQLGIQMVLMIAAFAAIYAVVLHPLLGRLVQAVAAFLLSQVVSVYRLDASMAQWDPGVSVVFGSAWPITILLIPFLTIALLGGVVYGALWR